MKFSCYKKSIEGHKNVGSEEKLARIADNFLSQYINLILTNRRDVYITGHM